MKIIRINQENLNAITQVIKEAEGRARERTITAQDVVDACIEVEKALRIPKCALDGVQIVVDVNAQSFPNAYKYVPESTHFKATYKGRCWRLDSVERSKCNGPTTRIRVIHTDASKSALIASYSAWA